MLVLDKIKKLLNKKFIRGKMAKRFNDHMSMGDTDRNAGIPFLYKVINKTMGFLHI